MSTPLYIYSSMTALGYHVLGYALPGSPPEAASTNWVDSTNGSLASSIAYDPSSGSVYANSLNNALTPQIIKFTSAGTRSVFAASISTSQGNLACDSTGNVYSQLTANTVSYWTPAGTGPFTYITNTAIVGGPTGSPMAFDASGYLWIVQTDGSVVQIAPGGGSLVVRAQKTHLTAPYHASNLAIDSAGNLYVSILTYINKISPCMVQSYLTNLGRSNGDIFSVGYDPASNTLLANLSHNASSNSSIYSIALPGGAYSIFNSDSSILNDITALVGPFATATVPACSSSAGGGLVGSFVGFATAGHFGGGTK